MQSEAEAIMQNRHPEIDLLLELQEMDREIMQLQDALNRYPAMWEEVKEGLRTKTAKVDSLEAAESERMGERRKVEQELRLSMEKLKQYQAQQMLVKTGKELTALSQQIDALKRAIGRLEERGVALLEETGQREELEKARAALAEAKAFARTERDRIRDQVNTKKQRIEVLRRDRVAVAARVSAETLEQYELTRNRWQENPVVSVRSGSCTGCHYTVLPNKLVDLHKGEEIHRCDHCGRLLSYDESFQPVESA